MKVKQISALYFCFYLIGIYWCDWYIAAICCIACIFIFHKIGYKIIQKKVESKKDELVEWIMFAIIHGILGYVYIIYICYSQYIKEKLWISILIVTVMIFGSFLFHYQKIVKLKCLDKLDRQTYDEKKKKQQEKVTPYAAIGAFIGIRLSKSINMTLDTLCIILILFLALMISCLSYMVYDQYYQYLLKELDVSKE